MKRLIGGGLAALAIGLAAAPVAGADPGDPVPDPSVDADFAYFGYLNERGVSVPDKYLQRALGIGICNALNRNTMSIEQILQSLHAAADPNKAWLKMTGAAIFYCPWNLDRVGNNG